MTRDYVRPQSLAGGLRLHLNENTSGCSPAVIESLQALKATDVSFYPEYEDLIAEVSAHLGVDSDRLLLTNGLDEGILATTVACLRPQSSNPPEGIVVEPAFEMYGVAIEAVGGHIVTVNLRTDFGFPGEEILKRLSPDTGVVFLNDPNNPTGQRVPKTAIRAIASALRPGAVVFVDEAYIDFEGDSFVDDVAGYPNVLVGRTFAKAYGLAALRVGAVLGDPKTLAPLRRVVPPYTINVAAAVALRAAVRDTQHVSRYVSEANESKQLLYATCDRLKVPYWKSAGNFVLMKLGDDAARVVRELAQRGITVRDRSYQPECAGCVRVTAGLVADTRACIAALEEVLCAGQ